MIENVQEIYLSKVDHVFFFGFFFNIQKGTAITIKVGYTFPFPPLLTTTTVGVGSNMNNP